jgi:hypothetical protein
VDLLYLPENQQQQWINQLRIWEIGSDTDPGFDQNRIELHTRTARSLRRQDVRDRGHLRQAVQKGIAARMLQWANELLDRAYVTDAGPDRDGDGKPDWFRSPG